MSAASEDRVGEGRCINCHWLIDTRKALPVCNHPEMIWEGKQIPILNKWDMNCKHYMPYVGKGDTS